MQARALAHVADILLTIPLARICFLQLNAIPPLEAIVRSSSSTSSYHRRNQLENGQGDGERAGGSAAEYADMKKGRLSALHSGRRHWTTVHALVKRCKACLESDTEVDRMLKILDGSRRINVNNEGDLDMKIRVTTPDDAFVAVIGYLRLVLHFYYIFFWP